MVFIDYSNYMVISRLMSYEPIAVSNYYFLGKDQRVENFEFFQSPSFYPLQRMVSNDDFKDFFFYLDSKRYPIFLSSCTDYFDFVHNNSLSYGLQIVKEIDVQGGNDTIDRYPLLDLILVAKDFDKTTGFNPGCDLNSDGKVDIKDLLIVAKSFGGK